VAVDAQTVIEQNGTGPGAIAHGAGE